jgi:hypothetical protein
LSNWLLAVPGSPSKSRLISPLLVRPSGNLRTNRFTTTLCSHYTGAKLFENVAFAGTIWARFLNGARWKRSACRLCVNANAVTFLNRLQTKHLRSQNSKFDSKNRKFFTHYIYLYTRTCG